MRDVITIILALTILLALWLKPQPPPDLRAMAGQGTSPGAGQGVTLLLKAD